VSFFLEDGAWDRPDNIDAFSTLRDRMAEQFPGRVFYVELCDQRLDVRRTIR
jgi:hypothetical protein